MVGARPRIFFPVIFVSLALTAWCQGFDEPARALAQKIAVVLRTREPVTFSFNSAAAVSPPDATAAREAIERQLPGAGINTNAQASITVAVTLSENLRDWVWVAEIRRGDAQEVVMEEWPKPEETGSPGTVVIEKRRILEQDVHILDVAPLGRDL